MAIVRVDARPQDDDQKGSVSMPEPTTAEDTHRVVMPAIDRQGRQR
jgi:hypothetical protein